MNTIDLTGRWTLRRKDGTGKPISATVPGDTIAALLAAKEIPDPYDARNELDVQWIGREDWVFERTFIVPARTAKANDLFLNFDSLDTVGRVTVNDRLVGRCENMFRRYRFDVRGAVKPGTNTIRVEFDSPEKTAVALAKKMPYPIPTQHAPVNSPNRNMLRKAQCHAGWDWGPCLMVSGIYGNTYLGAVSAARIEHVTTVQKHRRGACDVEVTCDALAPAAGKAEFEIRLGNGLFRKTVTLNKGLNVFRGMVTVRNPKLWWPNGHGDQPLYDLTVRVGDDEIFKRLGLRTMEAVSKPDKAGLSLFFRVNGRDIFAKGANWIPADAMPVRHTRERLDDLLTSAVEANMNMLRVWGGGQYETDDFYDLCDEKGLMVWQDFMFSCSLYPATPEFLTSVRDEAEYQVKRLRDHACLALWCGNNENVGALNWNAESRKNRDRYLVDYDRLNEGVLGATVDACDPTRIFWPSSPCGGRGDYSDNWHQSNRGDMHSWEVWHEGKNFAAYRTVTPRFCSEFGFQSFPSPSTIRTYARKDQLNVTSPVMEHHQKNVAGNTRIVETMTRIFRFPFGFDRFVYLSQVQQALAIETGVTYWRRLRPHCMGALYWQLNDLWPVCSWASLEYGGKWKLLHYAARRFFAPAATFAYPVDGGAVEAWVVNDGPAAFRGTLEARILDFSGRVLWKKRLPVALRAGTVKRAGKWAIADWTPDPAAAFLHLTLHAGKASAEYTLFLTEPKRCELQPARIRSAVRKTAAGLAVELTADKPAFYVSLDPQALPGRFSDNLITLLPGEKRALTFQAKGPVTAKELESALKVYDLRGSYSETK